MGERIDNGAYNCELLLWLLRLEVLFDLYVSFLLLLSFSFFGLSLSIFFGAGVGLLAGCLHRSSYFASKRGEKLTSFGFQRRSLLYILATSHHIQCRVNIFLFPFITCVT